MSQVEMCLCGGIVAALLFDAKVCFSDRKQVLPLTRRNVSENGLESSVLELAASPLRSFS